MTWENGFLMHSVTTEFSSRGGWKLLYISSSRLESAVRTARVRCGFAFCFDA